MLDLKLGDVVKLKSSSPHMTVAAIMCTNFHLTKKFSQHSDVIGYFYTHFGNGKYSKDLQKKVLSIDSLTRLTQAKNRRSVEPLFNIGNTVKLKSGGPYMTVTKVSYKFQHTSTNGGDDNDSYTRTYLCKYFGYDSTKDDVTDNIQNIYFDEYLLDLVIPAN